MANSFDMAYDVVRSWTPEEREDFAFYASGAKADLVLSFEAFRQGFPNHEWADKRCAEREMTR